MSHEHSHASHTTSRWQASRALLIGAVIVGIVLRILYVAATPYNVRTSLTDTKGHLQYIHYLADHHTIPPASLGWETHQAPLYYVFGAVWASLGLSDDAITLGLQGLALVCTMATVLLGAWISTLLFPKPNQAWLAGLFTLAIAVFPGLIELASRINNDVLYTPLSFLCFGLLLQWWEAPSRERWMALGFCLSVLMLTKTSGALLVTAAFSCLILHRRIPLRERGIQLLLGGLILGACVGWYHGIRLHQTYGIGNLNLLSPDTSGLNRRLLVGNQLDHYFHFSPLDTVLKAYVSPWDATTDREYLWEYLYRSAYFGEYTFGDVLFPLAQGILITGYLVLLLAAAGAVTLGLKKDRRLIVFGAVFVLQAAGLTAYRFLHPFACNQDFRFIPIIIAPLFACALLGLEHLPARLRPLCVMCLCLHALLCAAFITGVWLLGV